MTTRMFGMTRQVSMTRNSSLREFAKRERANSWQSKGKFALNSWIATQIFAKFARNDGGFCHFERGALAQSEKSIRILKYTLILWILRFLTKAQYDNAKSVRYDKTSQYDKVLRHFA